MKYELRGQQIEFYRTICGCSRRYRGMILPLYVIVLVLLMVVVGCEGNGEKSLITGQEAGNRGEQKEVSMPIDAAQLVSLVNMNGVTVDLIEVGPWYNRMPGPAQGGGDDEQKVEDDGRNRHLVAAMVLRNANDSAVQVTLEQAFISFDAGELGDAVTPGRLSVTDDTGMPSGRLGVTLAASEPKQIVRLRGYGLYGKGHENETLYLTLLLRVGDQYIRVRRGGKVVVAM